MQTNVQFWRFVVLRGGQSRIHRDLKGGERHGTIFWRNRLACYGFIDPLRRL